MDIVLSILAYISMGADIFIAILCGFLMCVVIGHKKNIKFAIEQGNDRKLRKSKRLLVLSKARLEEFEVNLFKISVVATVLCTLAHQNVGTIVGVTLLVATLMPVANVLSKKREE